MGIEVLRSSIYTLHALRIRTRSGSAAQRKSRNFNLGSPKRLQLLGSTWPVAARSGQVFVLDDLEGFGTGVGRRVAAVVTMGAKKIQWVHLI